MKIEIIANDKLTKVNGGDNKPPTYTGQDLANGAKGAATGFQVAGPPGAVVGFGAGVASRNVVELGRGLLDIFGEWRRGSELDAKREQLLRQQQQKKPPPGGM